MVFVKRKLNIIYAIAIILSIGLTSIVHAVPAAPDVVELEQADGTVFNARIKGDEWNNWMETSDGYTIAKGRDRFWYYIQHYDGATPVLSSVHAHKAPPVKLQKHIFKTPEFQQSILMAEEQHETIEEAPYGTFSGNILFILASFSDRSGTYSEASFASFITNNINDYFNTASYGNVTLSPANETFGTSNNGVVGWVNLGYNHPNTGSSTGSANQTLTKNAILAADPYVNFQAYDTNNDGYVDSSELAIVVVVAGFERAYSVTSPSVWGHKWSISSPPTVDNVLVGAYHSGAGGYAQFGEIHSAHMATMGIMVHELGHLIFGLPDLYDTDSSSSGIGAFGVMGGGSWGKASTDTWSGATPVLPCAWTKLNRGWVAGSEGSGTQSRGTQSIVAAGSASAASSNTVYKASTSNSNQYFLVENRQPLGYDKGLESTLGAGFTGGLAIWHVDDSRSSNSTDSNRWVDLEEADGTQMGTTSGASTDLWRSGNATTFNDTSTPDSKLYDGSSSNVAITSVSSSATTMTANFSSGGGGGSNDDIIGSFGPANGVYAYKNLSSWQQITSVEATALASGDVDGNGTPDVVGSFGPANGVYARLNGSSWLQITSVEATALAIGDVDGNGVPDIIGSFGSANGVYARLNLSSWVQITSVEATALASGDVDGSGAADIIGSFGSANGVYAYKNLSSWQQITSVEATALASGDVDGSGAADIIGSFGPANGVYARLNLSSWVQITSVEATALASGDVDGNGVADIIGSFGSANGVYARLNLSSWLQITSVEATALASGDVDGSGAADIIGSFGSANGVFVYKNLSSWQQITGVEATALASGDVDGSGAADIIGSFGSANGVFVYKNLSSWQQITSVEATALASGNIDGL